MSSPNSPTKSTQSQDAAGSRLGFLYYYCNPKMLLRRDFYLSGLRGGALTFVAVLSVLALYSVVAAMSVMNVIKYIKSRKPLRKGASSPKPPPGDFELAEKNAGKHVVPDLDSVQEIPGEMELAELKDVMPSPELIPEIDDGTDERDIAHGIMSDDDATLIGQEDYAAAKASPEVRPTIPAVPLENKFERPISPPATPPPNTQPEIPVVEIVPDDKFGLEEEPTKADKVVEATEVTVVEEAARAVEEHKPTVEEAKPEPIVIVVEAPPEPKLNEVSPNSEFVIVFEPEAEAPVPKEEPTKPVEEAAPVTATEIPAKALVDEPSVAEPAPVQAAEEAKPEEPVAALVAEPESMEAPKPVEASLPVEAPKPVEEARPVVVEEPKAIVVEEPEQEEPKFVEEPGLVAEPEVEEPKVEEPKIVEEPKVVEEPKPIEVAKPVEPKESPKQTFATPAPAPPKESPALALPKSLGRPRVMRRATGSTSAVAGVTTSPASSAAIATAPSVAEDNKIGAVNLLAGLRSNPDRPASPAFGRQSPALGRSASPALGRSASPALGRSASPAPRSSSPAQHLRSDSPSSDAAGSRPASPSPAPGGMARRGSIALSGGARPSSRQSNLVNVTTAPPRQPAPPSSLPGRPSSRQSSYSNNLRGGSISPPPMPMPPQRQGSLGRSTSPPPQGPQAAVLSPSVLSRKATLDANGSPGSPPAPNSARRTTSPARAPAEEFSTAGTTARRRVPFPSAPDGGQAPVTSSPNTTPNRPRPKPRTSTSNPAGAPNMLQASLLANLAGKSQAPSSPGSNSNSSNPASPVRRDSFASAVSKRDSIFSVYEFSDMDMSVSDLDFTGREGHRVGRLNSMSSIGSTGSEGMSGDDEEKRKKRAKRRAKAKAQAMQKQKRGKRN